MFETVVLIALIIGFVLVTVFSLAGMWITRHRDIKSGNNLELAATITRIDESLEDALHELDKNAALIMEELDEKYQSMLFLYNLLEDKKKEVIEMNTANALQNETITREQEPAPALAAAPAPKKRRSKPSAVNPKHKEILKLADEGQKPAEIAKELNMGQGEVRLILDLAKMH